jgi:hypothetical protein
MKRRNMLIVAGLAGFVFLALGGFLVYRQIEQQREVAEAMRLATAQLSKSASAIWANADMTGPNLEWLATLDGDVTTLTFTISNRTSNMYKNISFQGFALGKIEPREKATLPVTIAELAPGASQQFILRYDRLVWLGDDIPVNRGDLNWAQQPLDYSTSWVTVVKSAPPASDPNVTIKSVESSGSGSLTGVPIRLDEKVARAIKERRDAVLKAKAKKTESPPVNRPPKD